MNSKKSRKPILFIAILLTIAGFADIKYKGKFYQLLPQSIQSYLDKF